MSVILRTAGIDRSAEELAWDLENLITVWTAILNVVLERPSPVPNLSGKRFGRTRIA